MLVLNMENSTIDRMCRCCAAEGIFKDIKTSYHWMGEEEVYGDILRECFDVKLASVEDGGICEVCITQLRNASNFKKQVLHTEKKFKRHLENRFKPTEVKEEMSGDNANSSDDNGAADDSDEDEDYVPEFEIPIKTETPEESKSRKRAAKASSSRAKKSKMTDDDKSVQEAGQNGPEEPDLGKNDPEELQKQKHNIKQILLFTNATPIARHTDLGYACSFCSECFQLPADLKQHSLTAHDDNEKTTFMAKARMRSFLVKLDITNFECTICDDGIESLPDAMEHLSDHGRVMHKELKNYILPFKFDSDFLKCIFCNEVCRKFKTLQVHMYKHYNNYACNVCGVGFVNRVMVYNHYFNLHKIGTYSCAFCNKDFDTNNRRKSHETRAHAQKNYRCGYCGEKFTSFDMKRVHLTSVHGIKTPVFNCSACDKSYSKPSLLATHVKKDHLMETRYKCPYCDKAYFFQFQLTTHMVTHTRARKFKCEICYKRFLRIKSLKEHVKIHVGDRRFRCRHCDMTFVQKISLKNHLQKKHDEILI